MKYEAEHISRIDFQNPWYHVFLKPDEPRTYDPYFTQPELNGNYYVETENSQDRHTEAIMYMFTFRCLRNCHTPMPIFLYSGPVRLVNRGCFPDVL